MVADLIPERLGESGRVEDADLVVEEVARGGVGMADVGERPRDDDPVQARQGTGDPLGMSFDEVSHGSPRGRRRSDPFSPEHKTVGLKKQNLFGSGYAGLG
jgi:hypothetical protein